MIAKFRNEDGWQLMECEDIIIKDGVYNPDDGDGVKYVLGTPSSELKMCILVRKSDKHRCEQVYYGMDAYLMNNEGTTINAL